MTREHAKKILTHLRNGKSDLMLTDALDMAISALSESDNVGMSMSHRAIAKVIGDYIANHQGDSDKQYTAHEIKTLLISDDSDNKGEWIPIEEREPEVHKYVMFTTKTTRREIGYKAKEEPYYFLFGDSGAYVKSDYILAWMELPEPYKGE